MLEIALDARRGGFHLQIETRFASEWTVIFGPSGSGKSTLLRLLAGLDRDATRPPGAGRLVFDGKVFTDSSTRVYLPAGRRETALVTQQPALFPHLRVGSNVRYGIRDRNVAIWMERIEEVLELVGGSDLIGKRPHELSGGEAQRVALARAIAIRPRLLLLDEPFSALDGAASDALLDRLRRWALEHDVQAVLATHDATDAFATGAEVALLRDGRLVALGPAAQVLSEERNRLMQRLSE